MFSKETIEHALNIKIALSPEMAQKRDLWRRMLLGQAYWNVKGVVSQGFAPQVSSEFTRVTITDFEWNIDDPANPRPDDEDEPYELNPNSMAAFINANFAPFVENTTFAQNSNKLNNNGELLITAVPNNRQDGIKIKVMETSQYLPITYNDDNELIKYVSWAEIERNNTFYRLFEISEYIAETETQIFDYYAFASYTEDTIGAEIPLEKVPEWAHLEEHYEISGTMPWFVHIKLPVQNLIDPKYGAPIFANAVETIRQIDEMAELVEHEMKAGRLITQVSEDMVRKDAAGNYIIDKDLFIVFEGRGLADEGGTIRTHNPAPRIDAYTHNENRLLRRLETQCQLSHGIFSDVSIQAKTATEILHSLETFYNMNLSIQRTWEHAFHDLLAIMEQIALTYGMARGEYSASFSFGDSILADRATEFEEKMRLVDKGILSPVKMLAWYLNISEAKAEKELPGAFSEPTE